MTATTTWLRTRALSRKYDEGKFREGTQKKLGVATLLRYATPQTLDSLVEKLNAPTYWATVRRKDRNGNPLQDSWFIQKAGCVRGSIRYHLNELKKDGLVDLVRK
jgi:hypothetical protein